jgi:hypothetical protein
MIYNLAEIANKVIDLLLYCCCTVAVMQIIILSKMDSLEQLVWENMIWAVNDVWSLR